MGGSDGIAARKTLLGMFEASIRDNASAKEALAKCVLPTEAPAGCGADIGVVHAHHTALCSLNSGVSALLSFRAETLRAGIKDDEDRFAESLNALSSRVGRGGWPGEDNDIELDRGKGKLRIRGPAAIVLSVVLALAVVAYAVWQVSRIENVSRGPHPHGKTEGGL